MAFVPDRMDTPRLVLRLWEPDDVAAMADAVERSADHLRPYMAWIDDEPRSDQERAEWMRSCRVQWQEGREASFGMFHNGDVVGACGLHPRIGPGALEIGYWVAADKVRNGFATEAAAALTTAGLAAEGIERIEIRHDETNTVSGRVPAALGYVRGPNIDAEARAPAETGVFWTWYTTTAMWAPPPDQRFLPATTR